MTKIVKKAFNMFHVPTAHVKKAKKFARKNACKKVVVITTDMRAFTLTGTSFCGKYLVEDSYSYGTYKQSEYSLSRTETDNYGNPIWVRVE